MLRSQKIRQIAPEMDPLRLGMGWSEADLEKPQILVESTYGDSHPGSAHLNSLVERAVQGIAESDGKGARLLRYGYLRRYGSGARRDQLFPGQP
jgi:dihydroxy-acid dehydratase